MVDVLLLEPCGVNTALQRDGAAANPEAANDNSASKFFLVVLVGARCPAGLPG